MKVIGLLILSIGIALAASYGARVTPRIEEQLTLEGAAQFRGGDLTAAFEAYCKARKDAGLEPADGCPVEGREEQAPAERGDEEEEAPATYESLVASGRARLEAIRTAEEVLTGDVLDAREAWIAAFAANIEPGAAAAVARTPGPEERLSAWASQSGGMFGLGLALIVIGAFVGRIAVKREAAAEEPAEKQGDMAAKDFGTVLSELQGTVRRVADDAGAVADPKKPDYDRVKAEIEHVQLESFEPLIAARGRVQVKHGMAGFAEIFGPLSSAERRVNRAWSACVDKHWPETQASLELAARDLEACHAVLDRLSGKSAG